MKIMRRVAVFVAMLIACAGAFASPNTDLYDAVKVNSLSKVQSALRMGANPNQKIAAGGGKSSFALAVENGNKMIIEAMLKDACEPVAINGDSDTEPPLFIAVRTNNLDAIETLIKYGASVNVQYDGNTVLTYLLSLGDKHVALSHLIKCDEKYNGGRLEYSLPNEIYGRTILHYAVTGGNFNIRQANGDSKNVDVLISTGKINIAAQDNDGNTALHYALGSGKIDMASYFFANSPSSFSCPNDKGITPIGYYVSWAKSASNFSSEFVQKMVKGVPGIKTDTFNCPDELDLDNGLIEFARLNDENFFKVAKLCPDSIKRDLAQLKDREGNPFLCLAIQEQWSPDLVELMLEKTSYSDWRKLKMKTGKYKGKNAIEIMRDPRNRGAEDLYEDIFDMY